MYLAFEKNVDAVLVNENQTPPIVKLMDYGKYLYSKQKQDAKQKAKTKTIEMKELRMGIKIDTHDLEVKINKIRKFLESGDKVKATIILRGREMVFKDRVDGLIEKIRQEAGAEFDRPVERTGNRFSAVLTKKK